MNSSSITLMAEIGFDGELRYSGLSLNRMKAFFGKFVGNDVEITMVVPDGVRYWQHKYYRGFVLPDIALGMGENDIEYLHEFVLKQQFLFFTVKDYKDIPARHHKGIRIIMDNDQVIGYVPSMSAINYDEGKAFILKCEEVRDGLIDWSHHEKDQNYIKEYMKYRAKALKQEVPDEW